MRGLAAALIATGVACGTAVAVVQYQDASSGRTTVSAAPVPLPTARPTVRQVELAPCEAGWSLRRGVCTRVVQQLVARPAPTPAPARRDRPRELREDDADEVVGHDSDDDESREDRDEVEDRDEDHEDHEDREDREDHEDHEDED